MAITNICIPHITSGVISYSFSFLSLKIISNWMGYKYILHAQMHLSSPQPIFLLLCAVKDINTLPSPGTQSLGTSDSNTPSGSVAPFCVTLHIKICLSIHHQHTKSGLWDLSPGLELSLLLTGLSNLAHGVSMHSQARGHRTPLPTPLPWPQHAQPWKSLSSQPPGQNVGAS